MNNYIGKLVYDEAYGTLGMVTKMRQQENSYAEVYTVEWYGDGLSEEHVTAWEVEWAIEKYNAFARKMK